MQTTFNYLSSIGKIGQQLYTIETLDELLEACTEILTHSTGFRHLWVYLYQGDDKKSMRLLAASGEHQDVTDELMELNIEGDAWLEEVIYSSKACYCEDALTDLRTNKTIVKAHNICSIYSLPLNLHKQQLGILGMTSYQEEGIIRLDPLQQEFLSALAGLISITLNRILLKRITLHDSLTNMLNRRGLQEKGNLLLSLAQRNQRQLAVSYFDLNDFKHINDQFGHQIGDLALQHFSSQVKKRLRQSDLFSRIGGDEFVAVLSDIKQSTTIPQRLNRLLADLPLLQHEQVQHKLSASIGHAFFPNDGETIEQLLLVADKNMYHHKRNKPIKTRFSSNDGLC